MWQGLSICGGEGGIRTHERRLSATRSPGALLSPLGHLSATASTLHEKAQLSPSAQRLVILNAQRSAITDRPEWRRGWDSNPRGSLSTPKPISSRPRYDHFGTSPLIKKSFQNFRAFLRKNARFNFYFMI